MKGPSPKLDDPEPYSRSDIIARPLMSNFSGNVPDAGLCGALDQMCLSINFAVDKSCSSVASII